MYSPEFLSAQQEYLLSSKTVKVLEVKDDVVILDANHPLSGKKLIFDLEIVSIG
jgi:FKBP-type peptidyl-prolyl cis-trans isomerase 2